MAKVSAPNLALGSRGQIGKAMVTASWRGRQYVRRWVVPANPKTVAQTTTRDTFSFVNAVFKLLNPAVTAVWQLYAKGQPLTDRNAFQKFNLPGWRGAANMETFIASPGAKGGYAPATIVAVEGVGSAGATVTAPDLPTDWAITAAHFVMLVNGDLSTQPITASPNSQYHMIASPGPYTYDFAPDAGDYVVSVFFEMTNASGVTVYGPSLTVEATAT